MDRVCAATVSPSEAKTNVAVYPSRVGADRGVDLVRVLLNSPVMRFGAGMYGDLYLSDGPLAYSVDVRLHGLLRRISIA
jgi:hypothetical protein